MKDGIVALGQLLMTCLGDLMEHCVETVTLERPPQHAELVEHTTEHPHVRLSVVLLPKAHLGTQVVRSASGRLCHIKSRVKHLGDTKVTNLDVVFAVEEDILRFQVSMQDVL